MRLSTFGWNMTEPCAILLEISYSSCMAKMALTCKDDHGNAVNVRRLIDQIKIGEEGGSPASSDYIRDHLKEVEDQITPTLMDQLQQNYPQTKLSKKGVNKAIDSTTDQYKRALMEPVKQWASLRPSRLVNWDTDDSQNIPLCGVKEQKRYFGLPRLIEIVDARRIPSTPIMTIYLLGEHRRAKRAPWR